MSDKIRVNGGPSHFTMHIDITKDLDFEGLNRELIDSIIKEIKKDIKLTYDNCPPVDFYEAVISLRIIFNGEG